MGEVKNAQDNTADAAASIAITPAIVKDHSIALALLRIQAAERGVRDAVATVLSVEDAALRKGPARAHLRHKQKWLRRTNRKLQEAEAELRALLCGQDPHPHGRSLGYLLHDDLSNRERMLVSALRCAWHELNTIRARDGVAYHRTDGMPYTTEEWWDQLTERCGNAIESVTGEPPKPWPFPWESDDAPHP